MFERNDFGGTKALWLALREGECVYISEPSTMSQRPQDLLSPSSASSPRGSRGTMKIQKTSVITFTAGCPSEHSTPFHGTEEILSEGPWNSVCGLIIDCDDTECDTANAWASNFYDAPAEGNARLALEVLIKNGRAEAVPTGLMTALRTEHGDKMESLPSNIVWGGPKTLAPDDTKGAHSKWLTSKGRTFELHVGNPSEQVVETATRYLEGEETFPFTLTNYDQSAVPHVTVPATTTRDQSRGRGGKQGSGSRTRRMAESLTRPFRSKDSSGNSSPSKRIVPIASDRSGSSGTHEVHSDSTQPPQLSTEGAVYESGGSSIPHELIGDHPSTLGRIHRRGAIRDASSSDRSRMTPAPGLTRQSTSYPQTMSTVQMPRRRLPTTYDDEEEEDEGTQDRPEDEEDSD